MSERKCLVHSASGRTYVRLGGLEAAKRRFEHCCRYGVMFEVEGGLLDARKVEFIEEES